MNQHYPYEFHISRKARDLYQFDEILYAFNGNVIFANLHAVRTFTQKINSKRDLIRYPEQAVRASQLNAMGLIDEILHVVFGLYKKQKSRNIHTLLGNHLTRTFGKRPIQKVHKIFTEEFPPIAVYQGKKKLRDYLSGKTKKRPNTEYIVEEMILLWLANMNPAFSPFMELFNDERLEKETVYNQIIQSIESFFLEQPVFGPDNQPLIEMLRSPAIFAPHSLKDQLEYIRTRWGYLLGDYLFRLLTGLDFLSEEDKWPWQPGSGPPRMIKYTGLDNEPERFSEDSDWMPRVVMIAKNIYVWLHQLSVQYGRSLKTLDQIPDKELDILSQRGFNALWLIGLWERSAASKRIKQLCGNPEAEASAYSLLDYEIARDLGGNAAFHDLKTRAKKRGIRLAGDMVPNHMGIDSKWVRKHPDRFLSLPYSPFPSYTFNGPDLSQDGRISIYLEDHYYNRSDAAVIFKRIDRQTGDERYIYHGNDGTSMPWNDTAQINFLNSEAREAVIQTILHVANSFSIIRFDAAMTLVKKHIQRLWFPEPGSGGAIASRAGQGLSYEDFNRLIPSEFWREVVDRIQQEAPDTLLLAEAFWMLEGYFVRTLGMHRVYNSAFMNMLKSEENAMYRTLIKKTLAFNPEILKRFVNFMNNPDEETAIAQFGRDDKYFGVCLMMITMPGLPMFGHGQIEGFTEKYGMEYSRSYHGETPDFELIQRHEREIFPVLHKRYLFAHIQHFHFYDCIKEDGGVDENVFAFSNRYGEERVLVIYHNKYTETGVRILKSVPYSVPAGNTRRQETKTLLQGLVLADKPDTYTIFRDRISGLEYLRSNSDLNRNGLFVYLQSFKYHLFTEFREIADSPEHIYAHLNDALNGRGVPSVNRAMQELLLKPLHDAFSNILNNSSLKELLSELNKKDSDKKTTLNHKFDSKLNNLIRAISDYTGSACVPSAVTDSIKNQWPGLTGFFKISSRKQTGRKKKKPLPVHDDLFYRVCLLQWLFVSNLGKAISRTEYASISRTWIDEWFLGHIMADNFESLDFNTEEAWNGVKWIQIMTTHQNWFQIDSPKSVMESLLTDHDVMQVIGMNRYQGILWFNHESMLQLVYFLDAIGKVRLHDRPHENQTPARLEEERVSLFANQMIKAIKRSEYQVDKLLTLLSYPSKPKP